MNCPKCEAKLTWNKKKCNKCGQNLKIYKGILSASNLYYNDALVKARVRDLSGAVISLKKSLQLNKKNTDGRNLLGLVYYEMGETVAALSEWVVSKHFQAEDNMADDYMTAIQSNPNKLEDINQAIKKYNAALTLANQRSEDLAIIQLKKVLSLNPRFIRARNLLSLLYMKTGEKDKAIRSLKKVRKIDVNNTTTLKYLKESGYNPTRDETDSTSSNPKKKDPHGSFAPLSSYKEDKPNIWAFVNIILGIIIGASVSLFLIIPTVEKEVAAKYRDEGITYSEQIAKKNSDISSLENSNGELEEQVGQLQKQLDAIDMEQLDENLYDDLFKAAKLFVEKDLEGAAQELIKVSDAALENKSAKSLYELIKVDTFDKAAKNLYRDGYSAYDSGKYDEAITLFTQSIELKADNVDAVYFLGRSYHRLQDFDNAKENYNKVVTDFPGTSRSREAQKRLNEIN